MTPTQIRAEVLRRASDPPTFIQYFLDNLDTLLTLKAVEECNYCRLLPLYRSLQVALHHMQRRERDDGILHYDPYPFHMRCPPSLKRYGEYAQRAKAVRAEMGTCTCGCHLGYSAH